MESKNIEEALKALEKSLRPISLALLNAGIGYREFAEMSKSAIVGTATDRFGIRGRPTNISRVSAMTGLTRKEVKRVQEERSNNLRSVRVVPPAEILNRWHDDPDFLGNDGNPKKLALNGQGVSFSGLVRRYGGDIPVGAMLTELKRAGCVKEHGGHVSVSRQNFQPAEKVQQLTKALEESLHCLATTLNHNLESSVQWPDDIATAQRVRPSDISRIRNVTNERCQEFVKSMNDLFLGHDTIYADEPDSDEAPTVGVGIYYFETDDSRRSAT